MVDFDLGGHTYNRPAQVVQGNAPDQWLAIEKLSLHNDFTLSLH